MTWEVAETLADALLYEGYLLYPYRGSALKNRFRWQFGIVEPRMSDGADGADGADGGTSSMRTECLVEPGARPVLDVKVRFLQVEARIVERLARAPDGWDAVESLTVDGRELVTWDEARPRELVVADVRLDETTGRAVRFEVDGGREVEVVRDRTGAVRARIVRERRPLACVVRVVVEPAGDLRKVGVRIENVTPGPPGAGDDRPAVLRRSLIAAHTLLSVTDGAFVSLLDPPAAAAARAAACANHRTWPVLVGRPPERRLVLSAPVILYDYPEVAPESPGDLFDGTEIDEILTLRVLTLTDEERRAAAATDPLAREVIERTAALPRDALARLHGAVRSAGGAPAEPSERSPWEAILNPAGAGADETLEIGGARVSKGSRVRLRPPPGRRADAMDLFLRGQTATVAAVYRDLEDQAHIAVVVDAAGDADLHESNGRYFYFRPDEVELLDADAAPVAADARPRRVLVAGIGNMFLGDDGFGPAVTQRLASRALPHGVKVEDFGIRGVHLAYELLGASPAYDTAIIVDAVSRGGEPGTLYLLEPEVGAAPPALPDAHTLTVEGVLGYLAQIGGTPARVLVVGCEAASVAPEMGLSAPVAAAVDGAAEMVVRLLAEAR